MKKCNLLLCLVLVAGMAAAQKPDLKKFGAEIDSRLKNKCIGYGFMITDGMNAASLNMGGWERLPQDPPAKSFLSGIR